MSKRAEETALKAYPERVLTDEYGFKEDYNLSLRIGYTEGYEQAEKDLALTWENIAKIITIYEQCVESDILMKYAKERDVRGASEEILRRFNEQTKK